MALQLYASNSLESLSTKLSSDLKENHHDVFQRLHIVTQTAGINNWLSIRMAEQLGIASNFKFLSPNEIIHTIYNIVGGTRIPPMNPDQIQWIIYELLGEKDFSIKYPAIEKYHQHSEVKKLSLAAKLGDLFDQYQIYRPDKINQWTKAIDEKEKDLDWQNYLWHQLKKRTENIMCDKTSIAREIIEGLKDETNQERLKKKLPHLYFFGLAIITPYYLNLFHEIAKHISISFYLNNPAPDCYWMDDVTEARMMYLLNRNKKMTADSFNIGNDLLLNWGQVIKDSFWLLFNDETYLNNYDDDYKVYPESPNTLLKKIQSDIFNNAIGDAREQLTINDLTDGSITINTSYTPSREVEVLYNYLVQLIDERKAALAPKDIVVMVNDIDKYAPFIHAVFDNAPEIFPFTIADESITNGNNLFSALKLILSVDTDKFTAESVLELLENKYIRNRFKITNTELIRKAINDANIRIGIKGDKTNDTRFISWEYGLKRLISGICIGGGDVYEYENDTLYPLDTIEGFDSFEMIRFYHFVTNLIKYLSERNSENNLSDWTMYLKMMVEDLIFEAGSNEDEDYHILINQLESIEAVIEVSNINISFDAFKHGIIDKLDGEKRARSFIRGGITFCSFIPMRSIPFKVVCLLGLDFDKFPRKETPVNFSLLTKNKIRGDRNVKNNDKHLFLETLLSAENYLYLSYIGSSIKDGSPLPASSLVDELVDYISKSFKEKQEDISKLLITNHPLHGFSQRYFNQSGLVNYLSDEKYKSGIVEKAENGQQQAISFENIDINKLANFFKDPVKFYFNNTLKIYYEDENSLLPDSEIFELNSLEKWVVEEELLYKQIDSIEPYIQEKKMKGKIALKNMGTTIVENIQSNITPFKQALESVINGSNKSNVTIDLKVEDTVITGKFEGYYEEIILNGSRSKSIQKHIVAAYVKYLVARAQGEEVDFIFLYKDGEDYKQFRIDKTSFTQTEAFEKVKELIAFYKSGHEQMFNFYPIIDKLYKYVSQDYAYFSSCIETDKKNVNGYVFNDEYLIKAIENGFFDEEHFEILKENTIFLLKDLQIK